MNPKDGRIWVRRGLAALAVCAIVAILSAILQSVLFAVGDGDGALAVRGVLLVALTGAGLSLVALVVALAVTELNRDDLQPPDV